MTRRYLERGWRVIVSCRDPDRAVDLKALTRMHAEALHVLHCDLLNSSDIAQFGSAAQRISPCVDLLINNAGYLDRSDDSLAHVDEASVLRAYRTNAVGPLLVTRALLPCLRGRPIHKIVNLSSAMGSMGFPQERGSYGYRMSKAALNMLTVNLASELDGTNVVVAALHPGWVRTDMGGATARMEIGESVDGLLTVIDALEPRHSGSLIRHDGMILPY